MAFDTDTERALQARLDQLKREATFDRLQALPIRERIADADYRIWQSEAARRQRKHNAEFCRKHPELCR